MADLGGRPTKYREEYNKQAYKLALLGHTDAELAEFFEVAVSTIYEWKLEYPEFSESIKNGKEIADSEIAEGLYDRAKGAVITTQQAIKVRRVDYDDKGKKISESEEIEVVDLEQEVPPDTAAAIFWLKNRQSKKWRDRHNGEKEQVELEIKRLELEKLKKEINPPKVDSPDEDYKITLKPDEDIPDEPIL